MFGKPPGQPTLSKVLFFFKQQSPYKIYIYHQARRPNEQAISDKGINQLYKRNNILSHLKFERNSK